MDELERVEPELLDALRRADLNAASALLHNGFLITTAGWIAEPVGKGAWLGSFSERMTLNSFDLRVLATQRFGDVAVVLAESAQDYLGEILLFCRQWQVAELAYVVVPSARGRGLATKAVRLMSTWAFDRLGVQRLQLMVAVENEASHRVAEKNGYWREGVLRSAYEVRGARADMVMYSRLPGDPAFA